MWYWCQVASILSQRAAASARDVTAGRPKGRLRMGFRQDLSYVVRSLIKERLFAVTTI
jgi:hypothetical protein